jgi:excisionase family DNA binding protein
MKIFEGRGDTSSTVNNGATGLDRLPNQHAQNQPLTSVPGPSKEPAGPPKKDVLTVREAAALLGMSEKWVYRNYRDKLPHFLIPAGKKPRIRFKREALERWKLSHSFNDYR